MARRLRLGPASRPKALGVVAAAVLVIALVVTGRWLYGQHPPAPSTRTGTVSTQAPVRLASGVECSPGWVLVMSNHRSYPAGHPSKPPPTATAVACYPTTAQAASAGYAPAPLPAGALEVGGIYLTPTSRAFQASCQQVADQLGFVVPCPQVLPTSVAGAAPKGFCQPPSTCRRGQGLRFLQEAFVVPFGYVGAPGGYGALEITATPTGGLAAPFGFQCPDERRIATPSVNGAHAVLATCLDSNGSPQLSIMLVRWSQQGTSVVVSVLGASDVNQRLVVALAEHLRPIRPTN
jgi:hypothetical protein